LNISLIGISYIYFYPISSYMRARTDSFFTI
jgi:hypothetical protein